MLQANKVCVAQMHKEHDSSLQTRAMCIEDLKELLIELLKAGAADSSPVWSIHRSSQVQELHVIWRCTKRCRDVLPEHRLAKFLSEA